LRASCALALAATLVGCGSDSSTGPGDDLPTNGSMSARIDGTQWTANVGIHAVRATGAIGFAGSDGQTLVSLGVAGGVGVHAIGGVTGANGTVTTSDSQRSWSAVSNKGSGTITITTLTEERVAGTFSFTAPPVETTDASGTRVVTEGVFDIRF
jgi:hypothetical protein